MLGVADLEGLLLVHGIPEVAESSRKNADILWDCEGLTGRKGRFGLSQNLHKVQGILASQSRHHIGET